MSLSCFNVAVMPDVNGVLLDDEVKAILQTQPYDEVVEETETFGANNCLPHAMLCSLMHQGVIKTLSLSDRQAWCAGARRDLEQHPDVTIRPVWRDASGNIDDSAIPFAPYLESDRHIQPLWDFSEQTLLRNCGFCPRVPFESPG